MVARREAAHCPYWSRSASDSGKPAVRIAACAPAMSYSARRHSAVHACVSSTNQAARGSPSRGWPVEPGLSSHSPVPTLSRSSARRVEPLAGADLPEAVWFVAFGPLPVSVVAFARLYGFSPRNAATAFALSTALAVALLPLALLIAT